MNALVMADRALRMAPIEGDGARPCHSLKGVAGSAGATVLSDAARAIEESLRKEQRDRAIESPPLVRRRAEEALAELPLLIDAI